MASSPAISIAEMRRMIDNKTSGPATPVATLKKGKDGEIDVTTEAIDALYPPVLAKVTDELKPVLIKTISDGIGAEVEGMQQAFQQEVDTLRNKIKTDRENLESSFGKLAGDVTALAQQVRPIEIITRDAEAPVKLEGVQHEKFELLLRIVGANLPVFMVGPAGTGKTLGAETVARSLGLDFYAISVGSQTSKSDIFGYQDAQGNYHATAFRLAYENGGVFLLDEADAGNANVLVGLNASLSNGYVFFPDGKMVQMHENFRMIATANTFGNGASRQYVGRNQLDAATLDRFTVLTWDIDDRIEEAIAAKAPNFGARWLRVVRAVREEAIDRLELRAVVSPRATLRGSTLLESGVTYEDAVQVALIANMPEAEREVLLNIANATWAKGEPKRKNVGSKTQKKIDLDTLLSVYDGDENIDAEPKEEEM
jgi:MoxR-like ATPases